MTIEEIKQSRVEAENKIVDILNNLELSTHCICDGIDLKDVYESYADGHEVRLGREVNINLVVK